MGKEGGLWLANPSYIPAWRFLWVLLCSESPLGPTVPDVMVGFARGFPALLGGEAGTLA